MLTDAGSVGIDADGMTGAVPRDELLRGPEPLGALGAPKEKLGEDDGAV